MFQVDEAEMRRLITEHVEGLIIWSTKTSNLGVFLVSFDGSKIFEQIGSFFIEQKVAYGI